MATRNPPPRNLPGYYGPSRSRRGEGLGSFLWWVLRLTNLGLMVFLAAVTGVILGSYSGIAQIVPKIGNLSEIRPGSGSRIISADGVTLAVLATENRQYVPLDRIPAKLQEAVLATEDRDFYRHVGVDPRGLMRAAFKDIVHGKREGASTITQQLAGTVYLNRRERTLSRKVAEAVLAIQLERAYTKPEILELYLNQVYFGEGAYGVQVAAKTYFNKDVAKLDTAECAMLAGLLRAPNWYSPFEDKERAVGRRDTVLSLMEQERYLTREERAEALAEPLHLSPVHKPLARTRYLAPWFVNYVIQQFESQYGPDALYQGNYAIQTTINMEMQKAAEEAVQRGMERARGYGANAEALVSLDVRTGAIKAMVGGANWDQNQYNITAQGQGRQAGSSFKPFVYTAALLQGYTPDSRESGAAVSYAGVGGKRWTPQNYEAGSHYGMVTFRQALMYSLNTVAVKVASKIGIGSVIEVADKFGIRRDKLPPYLSTAIGAASVTPLEMASAFSVFATRGMRTEPYAIEKIIDANGRVVEQHKVVTWRVLDEGVAETMVDMMSEVINHPGATAYRIHRQIGDKFKAAGKTGTSNDHKDAWFVGYTDNLSTAVWTGNQKFTPMRRGAVGGTLSAPVWADFMLQAEPIMIAVRANEHSDQPIEVVTPEPRKPRAAKPEPTDQTIPSEYTQGQEGGPSEEAGRVEVNICPESGLLAGPNCPAPNTVGYDLSAGDRPPDQVCDIHGGGTWERAPERPRAPRREGRSGEKVTLSVCAITKQLATPYCPVPQNMTFNVEDAPTETCTRHGR